MKLNIKLSLILGLMISAYSFADDMSTTDQQPIAQNAQEDINTQNLQYSHEQYLANPTNPDGICWFDVDGTLTQNPGNVNTDIINVCLKKNFAVGIITANSYQMDQICDSATDQPKKPWMSQPFCTIIRHSYPQMLNNNFQSEGKNDPDMQVQPRKKSLDSAPGFRKAYQAQKTAKEHYNRFYATAEGQGCNVLFDDQEPYIDKFRIYLDPIWQPQVANGLSTFHTTGGTASKLSVDNVTATLNAITIGGVGTCKRVQLPEHHSSSEYVY